MMLEKMKQKIGIGVASTIGLLSVWAPNPIDAINAIFDKAIQQLVDLANGPAGLIVATWIWIIVVFKWIRKVKAAA